MTKQLTIDDMYRLNDLLNQAEEILRWTQLADECILINQLNSYFRIKRNNIFK